MGTAGPSVGNGSSRSRSENAPDAPHVRGQSQRIGRNGSRSVSERAKSLSLSLFCEKEKGKVTNTTGKPEFMESFLASHLLYNEGFVRTQPGCFLPGGSPAQEQVANSDASPRLEIRENPILDKDTVPTRTTRNHPIVSSPVAPSTVALRPGLCYVLIPCWPVPIYGCGFVPGHAPLDPKGQN